MTNGISTAFGPAHTVSNDICILVAEQEKILDWPSPVQAVTHKNIAQFIRVWCHAGGRVAACYPGNNSRSATNRLPRAARPTLQPAE
jgi:hypothetical protein